jgi:hypothetical protein
VISAPLMTERHDTFWEREWRRYRSRVPTANVLIWPPCAVGRSCADHDVPLHVFDWRWEHHAAGLARDALYLLRPDTYVALASFGSWWGMSALPADSGRCGEPAFW